MGFRDVLSIVVVLVSLLVINVKGSAMNTNDLSIPYTKSDLKELRRNIEMITSDKRATVGVALATDEYEILTLNRRTHFPLMSVFKFHIALAVLDKLDKNNTSLDSLIFIEKSKLLHDTYSPIVKKFPNQDLTISIGDLIRYCVSYSDNNACDFLIGYVGGISKVEDYIKGLGVTGFNLSFIERAMHDDINKQYKNWSTPNSVIDLMQIFLTKPLFSEQYKDFLIQAMTDTSTGKNKLKAFLPSGVVVGHKTGSSNRTDRGVQIVENDIAFIYLPDGKRYYVSVFVKNSWESDDVNVAIIAQISKVIYDFLCEKKYSATPGA